MQLLLLFSLFWSISCKKSSSNEDKVTNFLNDNLKELNVKNLQCKTSKVSFLLWMKSSSLDKALSCTIKNLMKDNLAKDEKQLHWMLAHDIYKDRKSTKKKNFALKQASNMGKKVYFKNEWYFLGPFQIGKPELDGNPITSFPDVVSNRWNTKYEMYSELMKSGVVKWIKVYPDAQHKLNLQLQVDWNDLIMSLQSMAITEWQGLLVNEFAVMADSSEILVQCLGVNIFYINDIAVNGDVYYRSVYWYPLLLNAGVHVIKVPVRAKSLTFVQCNIKTEKRKQHMELHNVQFSPDLVDNNWFSYYGSISATNLSPQKTISVKEIVIERSDLGDSSLQVDLIGESVFQPGQVNTIIFKFLPSNNKERFVTCKQDSYSLTLAIKFSSSKLEKIDFPLRCRNSDQSFLFTFLDHDGSIQHAAAVKPLKPCLVHLCPVLLTLHGTGVQAQNQADSYKQMVKKKFLFGVEKLWLLAPTRHGAHNWEGPGEQTSLAALEALATQSKLSLWLGKSADKDKVVFAGHSMGGHGAWQLATHNPDKALAVISAAGWLSKEDYGDSNLFYRHDVAVSHVDPMIKAVQEACISENQADKYVSNLKGIPVMIRIGSEDKTVHPYFSRRMFRLLKENKVNVTYKEFPGKDHWWWDTKSENDGGVTNDILIRNFARYAVEKLEEGDLKKKCKKDSSSCTGQSKYTRNQDSRTSGQFSYITYNPATFHGGRGIKVLRQKVPLRVSKYTIQIDQSHISIQTSNIQSFSLREVDIDPIGVSDKEIAINGKKFGLLQGNSGHWEFCSSDDSNNFSICGEESKLLRNPLTYGPARRVAVNSFVIIVCDNSISDLDRSLLNSFSTFLINLFFLTSDARSNIYSMSDVSLDSFQDKNIIFIGTSSCAQSSGLKQLIKFENKSAKLGKCTFESEEELSAIYLLPHGEDRLMLLLTGVTISALTSNLRLLAVPTIPPMARSPFSNLVPDYVLVSSNIHKKGPGAYLCAGFWNNNWGYDPAASSCTC